METGDKAEFKKMLDTALTEQSRVLLIEIAKTNETVEETKKTLAQTNATLAPIAKIYSDSSLLTSLTRAFFKNIFIPLTIIVGFIYTLTRIKHNLPPLE